MRKFKKSEKKIDGTDNNMKRPRQLYKWIVYPYI